MESHANNTNTNDPHGVFHSFNATPPSLPVYRTAIECCVAARQADQATQLLLSSMEIASSIVPTTEMFETVIVALCQQTQWRRAVGLLDVMDRMGNSNNSNNSNNNTVVVVHKSRRLYNALLNACARAKEPAQAKALLVRMYQRDQIRPDIASYNAVMSACVGADLWRDALALLDQVHREPGVAPDLYTYTNAIRACAKGRLASRAMTLLDVVKDKGLKMDAYCYTAAMEACGDWRKALDLLQEMRANGIAPTEVSYSVLIKSCGNSGQWEKALELLDSMRGQGMTPNLFVYNAAATAIAKAAKRLNSKGRESTTEGKLHREMDRLLRQMEQDQINPDGFTYTSAISCCGSEGLWAEAMSIMDKMQRGGPTTQPNRVAYTAAIASCATANQPDDALRLFRQMKDRGVSPDTVAYNALFAALRAGRRSDEACELWDEMMGRTNRTETKTKTSFVTMANKLQPDIITLTE
jgi:pentatricopeptide repeat domain-containing protein 1